jgi:hypothetical protein
VIFVLFLPLIVSLSGFSSCMLENIISTEKAHEHALSLADLVPSKISLN